MAIQNNKNMRAKIDNPLKKNLGHDEQLSLDQQLVRLEDEIRKLKIEFDIFFNGGMKRAPYEAKNRVETIIKRIADDRSLTYAQRYQYNSLVARFTSFRELWRRTMQGREEGRDPRFAQAAKSVEKTVENSDKKAFVCTDVKKEVGIVKEVYEALMQAKAKCGEATDLPFEFFHYQLSRQTDSLKQTTGSERVTFSVGVENGQVLFKAKGEK